MVKSKSKSKNHIKPIFKEHNFELHQYGKNANQIAILAISYIEDEETLSDILKTAEFNEVKLPNLRIKIQEEIDRLEKIIEENNALIKTIEEKAFFLCDPKEIILPDGLETIGKDAFGFCSSLKEVTVPASVTRIDDYAFYSCTSLLEVNMLGNESNITLGKKWYPTNNGASLGDELIINWVNQ